MYDYYYNTGNNKRSKISSPESTTERLLFDYLRPHLERQQEQKDFIVVPQQQQTPQQAFLQACWDDSFLSLEEEESNHVMIELNNFSDLKVALKDIEELETYPTQSLRARAHHRKRNNNRWSTTEEDLINLSSTSFTVPPAVRVNIESSQILDALMHRAVQHWCCIGFKVAPISVNLICDWRNAPQAIVYSIASISLVTFMDQAESQLDAKQAAMAFYEQARNKMDDILFDDMQPLIIQSYFCLSYASNLLRLYEQQRTWGGLASISLQHLAKKAIRQQQPPKVDKVMLGCWFRWYYVDAWMCLTLNRDCLLPDTVPWIDMQQVEQHSIARTIDDQHHLYSFANLTHYMRRYIRALHSGKLFANEYQKLPSQVYYTITKALTNWYSQLPKYTTITELHLHLCYNSMRLVVLYQFLNPQQAPSQDVILDCLQTNLELLQALQQLKSLGCDQSTYHHMFFAIHNTAKRIYQYQQPQFTVYAQEQLRINLTLLKNTPAYAHDVFKMKLYAEKIQDQFTRMKIPLEKKTGGDTFVFRRTGNTTHAGLKAKNHQLLVQQLVPSVIVFKQENISSTKRPRK